METIKSLLEERGAAQRKISETRNELWQIELKIIARLIETNHSEFLKINWNELRRAFN